MDAEGRPLRRGPIRMLVILHVTSRDPTGSVSHSSDSLGFHETDERGELDLTEVLPALNLKTMHGDGFSFALEGEGIFRGTMAMPNFEISVAEIARKREEQAGGPVVIDVPALPYKTMTVAVRNPDREPGAGVGVIGLPASYFADEEYVSDAKGRIELRLRRAEPFPPPRPQAKGDRLRLVAKSPWVGRVEFWMLAIEEVPGGPQNALVVRRAVTIALNLVNDGGEPIAWTEVTVDGVEGKTDAAGVVMCAVAEGAKQVEVKVPGHLPAKVKPAGHGEETTLRLVRARELRVRVLMPDGTPALVPLIVTVVGEGRRFGTIRNDPMERVMVYLVPRRTVRIATYPQAPGITGSMDVGPDETEVVLKLRKK